MLEFQEGFFEQEIRDGFYLDATMKTVWAAELEVLQKVAEVCDKYNLTWYAACGTLLGAIRHEGFVPWDDDMDIWMLRKDYNKLMEVLPKELPEHYRVRSPLTEEGYDQFHTCVNSGSGVSIAKDWLEEFHGCPFTVGLDIFPLDYLPRNEEEREMQKRLFLLVGRMAQQAKETDRGNLEVEDEEDVEDAVAKSKADILEGIQYLEKNFNLKINKQLVEDEQWYEASSELWKWANYIAMMYGEEDGDYLVEYVDYTKWEHKKYPKEWFDEEYSATFENFMLPIPAGYHEILTKIYGNYMYYQRKTGQHEYPYYARQLRQLKEYVKDVESRAGRAGIVQIEDMEVVADSVEIPAEWLPIVTKKDGTRKKIVLSANDPAVYMAYGEEALDKLESALARFEEAQGDVILWWRPMAVMEKLLRTVSDALAERYVSILNAYKNAGWGICDETDNVDRAVANCDVYYGEMNAILQPFQNAGKPALIAHMGDVDYKASNEARILEHKAFPNFTDFVEKDGKIYGANVNYNGLMIVDKEKGILEDIIPFEGEDVVASDMHYKCIEKEGKICFLPVGAGKIHIYDIDTKMQWAYEVGERGNAPLISWSAYEYEEMIYLMPCCAECRLWKWDAKENTIEHVEWWSMTSKGRYLYHGAYKKGCFYTLHVGSNVLSLTNIGEELIKNICLPDDNVVRIEYDGLNFWYIISERPEVVCWNIERGIIGRYSFEESADVGRKICYYLGMTMAGDYVVLVDQTGDDIYVIHKERMKIQHLYTVSNQPQFFLAKDKVPYFIVKDSILIIKRGNINGAIVIDLKTGDAEQLDNTMMADVNIEELKKEVLLRRGALLYEDTSLLELNSLVND